VAKGDTAPPFGEVSGRPSIWALRRVNERQLRRRRQIEEIFRRGRLRAIVEIFEELVRQGLVDERELDGRIPVYAAVDPELLRALGGDQLPPLPLHVVARNA
jgi:hypothetical protein